MLHCRLEPCQTPIESSACIIGTSTILMKLKEMKCNRKREIEDQTYASDLCIWSAVNSSRNGGPGTRLLADPANSAGVLFQAIFSTDATLGAPVGSIWFQHGKSFKKGHTRVCRQELELCLLSTTCISWQTRYYLAVNSQLSLTLNQVSWCFSPLSTRRSTLAECCGRNPKMPTTYKSQLAPVL